MRQELRGRAKKWYVSSCPIGLIYVTWAERFGNRRLGMPSVKWTVEELLDRWRVQEQSK